MDAFEPKQIDTGTSPPHQTMSLIMRELESMCMAFFCSFVVFDRCCLRYFACVFVCLLGRNCFCFCLCLWAAAGPEGGRGGRANDVTAQN